MTGLRLRAIFAALLAALVSLSAPAQAQSSKSAEEAEKDRIFAELKKVTALEKEGKREAAVQLAAKLCRQSKDPATYTNFACFHLRNEYKGHAVWEETMLDLCLRGSGSDCMSMFFHYNDRASEENKEIRLGLIGKACENGEASGCRQLGYASLMGELMPPNPTQAKQAFEHGCTGIGDAETCGTYLDLWNRQIFGTVDKATMVRLAKGACPLAPARTTDALCIKAATAALVHAEGAEKSLVRQFVKRGCYDYSGANACYWYAEDLKSGTTGPADPKLAAETLAKACRIKRDEEVCS